MKENLKPNKKKRGRPKGTDSKLTHDLIVATAKEWIFREKKSLTMRGLARHLDIDPMAIYYYFDNKADLVKAVTVSVMQEVYFPKNSKNWQGELKKLCYSYLRLLQEHPGLLETILSMGKEIHAPAGVFGERFHLAIVELELDRDHEKVALHLLADYLHGFAFAMQFSLDKSVVAIEYMDAPFALYIRALEGGKTPKT